MKVKLNDRAHDQRNLLIRGLSTSVILHESVVTTPPRAMAVASKIDRLMTIAKTNDNVTARRRLLAYLLDDKAVSKIMDELVDRTSARTSGYTRRLRLPSRTGDGAPQVVLQLVDTVLLETKPAKSAKAKAEGADHA